jgi:hypothetical protein
MCNLHMRRLKGTFDIFCTFQIFLQFRLNFFVAQEKLSVIRLTVRMMPKLTVIRIKLFPNRTNTSSRNALPALLAL